MPIVTIRGQLGSGAPEVGRMVAESIGAEYVDREIIAEVAERVQRDGQEVAAKEMPPGSLLGRIVESITENVARGAAYETIYLPTWETPLEDERYIQALTEVIQRLATLPSVVIRGRGSQFILKDNPRAFHVLLVASLETRVMRVARGLRMREQNARKEIERFDSSRRAFIRHYFHEELEDPIHHHLVINTDRISYEAATQIIVNSLRLLR